jgi:hypothetical protein
MEVHLDKALEGLGMEMEQVRTSSSSLSQGGTRKGDKPDLASMLQLLAFLSDRPFQLAPQPSSSP